MTNWLGPFVVSPLWGLGSTQLLLGCWFEAARLGIAVVAFVRGRISSSRAGYAIFEALIGGVVYAALLRLGFWLLYEAFDLGRTALEQVVFWFFVALSAPFMLRRLRSKVEKSWRTTMTPQSAETAKS